MGESMMRRHGRVLTYVLLVTVASLVAVAAAEDLPTPEQIKKMRVKQIKIMLKERGVLEKCKGCAEKDDFVKLLQESIHLPKVETIYSGAEPPPPPPGGYAEPAYEDIMARFKEQE